MGAIKNFKHNHYVPEWYQKRFMLPGQGKYSYLDLKPDTIRLPNGQTKKRRALLPWGPVSCFAERDLYTTTWGGEENVDIEKFYFGKVDGRGRKAVEFFGDFRFDREGQQEAFYNLMTYMSVQKLRTPKGLGWLSTLRGGKDKNHRLMVLQYLQNMFCAIWTECIWQIADASRSATKFIISDHPVTVYNRGCFPGSAHCTGFNDPEITLAASHTYIPLSLNKVLILTNLNWVRNPYQKEQTKRPNADYFHDTIFKFTDIQTRRWLSEQEVREINYITKQRAYRYIAAAEAEWLYPEQHLPTTHWNKLGDGLLLMPEPRDVNMGGEVIVGYKDGRAESWSEYGHRPWQKGFKDDERFERESAALERFKAEWSVRQGPEYRGTSFQFHRENTDEPHQVSADFHQHYLDKAKQYKKRHR